MTQPEPRLGERARHGTFRRAGSRFDLLHEPDQPAGDFEPTALRAFEDGVVVLPFAQELRGKAEAAHRPALVLRQRHVGNGARDPAVAVFERMQGDEPQVGKPGANQAVRFGLRRVEPAKEAIEFRFQYLPGWRDEVDPLPVNAARDHLHGLMSAQLPRPD